MEKNLQKGKTGPQFQSWTDVTKVAEERDKWRGLVKARILLKEKHKQIDITGNVMTDTKKTPSKY